MIFIMSGPRSFGFHFLHLGFSLARGLIVIVLICMDGRDIILIGIARFFAQLLQIGDDEGLAILGQLNSGIEFGEVLN